MDVRETYEWDEGRIAGARHVEMDQLSAEAGSLTGDPPVVFYCRTGARSGVAAQAFRASGLDAYNLAGGLAGLGREGAPDRARGRQRRHPLGARQLARVGAAAGEAGGAAAGAELERLLAAPCRRRARR